MVVARVTGPTRLRGLSVPAAVTAVTAVTPMAAGVHCQHQAYQGERHDGSSGRTGHPQDPGQDGYAEVQLDGNALEGHLDRCSLDAHAPIGTQMPSVVRNHEDSAAISVNVC